MSSAAELNSDGRRTRGMLKSYYAQEDQSNKHFDLDDSSFKPDQYLDYLLKKSSLNELMHQEEEIVQNIRSLDSEMQTLVYENYNKFITATETIRKMKSDFGQMEEEMRALSENMDNICDLSTSVSDTLQQKRSGIRKLAGVHTLLQKLQFLFELPARLKKCIEVEAYSQAVRYYTRARAVLNQYQNMPTFAGISQDCGSIIYELGNALKEKLRDSEASSKQLAEYVDLLLQLEEPADSLCDEYLISARSRVDEKVKELEDVLQDNSVDILEFIDIGCNGVLSNVSLLVVAYNDMFLNRAKANTELDSIALQKVSYLVKEILHKFFALIQKRVQLEKETGDNAILVRALDRFHRRLQAMNKLLPTAELATLATEIVFNAAKDRIDHYYQALTDHLGHCITDIRQALAAPKLISSNLDENSTTPLQSLVQNSISSLVEQIKAVLANLQAFIATDITFAMKLTFRKPFCVDGVREGLVVKFLRRMLAYLNELCEKPSGPATLLLLLSKLASILEENTVSYLLILVDEQFLIVDENDKELTNAQTLKDEAKATAKKLLNNYVRLEGQTLSHMVRKSVETRDWLNTIEPRNVRAVMKRVVEDTSSIDAQVGQLYDDLEEQKKDRGSDSTKRSASGLMKSSKTWSFTPSTTAAVLDNSAFMTNISKLFSDKIDIFSEVDASRASIMTGIIKIVLKTLLECVRLRTFSKYGLQQVQVDTHYLQMYLWRFVQDENLVHRLLDEIVSSSLHRCIEPSLMENSVIELICERG